MYNISNWSLCVICFIKWIDKPCDEIYKHSSVFCAAQRRIRRPIIFLFQFHLIFYCFTFAHFTAKNRLHLPLDERTMTLRTFQRGWSNTFCSKEKILSDHGRFNHLFYVNCQSWHSHKAFIKFHQFPFLHFSGLRNSIHWSWNPILKRTIWIFF